MLRPRMSFDRPHRRGSVASLVALSLPVLIGVSALGLDAGLLYVQRRQAQTAAEAVSMAAAYQLYLSSSNTSGATAAATALATHYGLASPTISMPPTSGTFANKSGYVQVSVTTSSPRIFSAIWGAGNMSVTASATARAGAPYSTAAILVLNPTGSDVGLSGSSSLTAVGGSITVDSTSPASITMSGSASITTPVLNLSGGISGSGSSSVNATVKNTGQPATPDPLVNISPPSSTGMTVQSSSEINLSGSTTRTLNPGVYNGGISLSSSSSVTLNPGVYYINGGGINLSGSSGITGNGVFIYNTGGGEINLSGSGTISLNPMSSGSYAGITVFQDRSNTTAATMSGGSNISNTGTFYLPSATMTLSGSSAGSVMAAQIIAKNLTFSGSSNISVKYNNSVAGSGFALVQ